MIFYVRKIFRKLTGNYTFVVITDREDLDGQIYRNFLNTGAVRKHEAAQPKNSTEMRKFLGQNKRIVFTLIQKFRYDKGKIPCYPIGMISSSWWMKPIAPSTKPWPKTCGKDFPTPNI